MKDQSISPTKPKLIGLIFSFTLATVAGYSMHFWFGETDLLDWRAWVEISPPILITLIFGFLASGWREVSLFAIGTSVIDFIFLGTILYFVPFEYAQPIEAMGGSLFAILVVVLIPIWSFSLFAFAYLVALLSRYFFDRRETGRL